MSEDNKIEIFERLTALETNMTTILKNHFPHLQKAIDKLSNRFWGIIILLIANLISIIFVLLDK